MGKFLKTTDTILFDVQERVARITLNRPGKRNAITGPMITELHDALLEADARTDVNVVVLQGAGKDFCAGYDLAGVYSGIKSEAEARADATEQVPYRSLSATLDDDCWNLERTQRQTTLMFQIHKPIIARVHGNCLAGGTDFALMCDMVI
ncbi:MAG TPA: enoyl-CoA hydratase-related protein, partial [Steroidobacteraceae bacterium]|nr:enoyl-CoA hydratase-related protein [Steroidobacteraceae bacterium]